jgi:hypothetical protein
LASCGSREKEVPDVSSIKIDLKVHRFEKELFEADTTKMEAVISALAAKYPVFSDLYFSRLIGVKTPEDSTVSRYAPSVRDFVNFPSVRKLYDTVQTVYGNIDPEIKAIKQGLQFYKHYFPEKVTPEIYTYVSEYNIGAFTYGDSILGIGLDMYFGENYAPYLGIPLPQYITRTLTRDHLPVYAINALVDNLVSEAPPLGSKLLDNMIYNGKKIYIAELLMPFTPDSLRLGYTQKQVEWCNDNAAEMWAFFMEKNLLYNGDHQEIGRFTNPAPTSPGMPAESPGRTANWIGWQIVKAYMDKNPMLKLKDLLRERDAQKILTASKYKPKK